MTHTDIRQRANIAWSEASELIQQLPPERLTDVVHWLESLNANEETTLIEIIQRRLSPYEQRRLEELRDRSEQGILTESEQHEYITYTDRHLHRSTLTPIDVVGRDRISNADHQR